MLCSQMGFANDLHQSQLKIIGESLIRDKLYIILFPIRSYLV